MTQPQPLTIRGLPARHGFFTRTGGVSVGPYASLNCSLSGRDSPDAVRENRTRAARALGAEPDRLLGLTQVHGADVVTVDYDPWKAGDGPKADAMVTRRPDLALGIITADCAPVLLVDPDARVVGAAHAGWRGAVAGILGATMRAMAVLGARADRTAAVIGPCIGPASYEVATDLRDAVLAASAANAGFFHNGREGRWQFDLAGYCRARLVEAGVGSVRVSGVDTLTEEDRFFSHRRRTLRGDGPIGHQISIIALAQ